MIAENVQVTAEEITPPAAPIETPPETQITPTADQLEWEKNMGNAFELDTPPTTPPVETTPVTDIAPPETVVEATPAFITELGFTSIDEAKLQIAELKKLKDTPPATAKEIEFADENSKKLHELLRDGSPEAEEIAFKHLEAKRLLKNMESMGDEAKLKLYIKMQNPRFDTELVDEEYNELYSINEDDIDYSDDPNKLKRAKLKMEQRIEDDVLKAKEYFNTLSQKVQLPDIAPKTGITGNKDFEDFEASKASADKYLHEVIIPGINALTEDKAKMSFDCWHH